MLRRRVEEQSAIDFTVVEGEFEAGLHFRLEVSSLDGLFGSGLNRPLEGGFLALVKFINESKQTVVSIDSPSGMFPDNRFTRFEGVIKASYTFTSEFPKLAFLFAESEPLYGVMEALDIVVLAKRARSNYLQTTTTRQTTILIACYEPRNRFSHKGTYGHALLMAGSRGKLGVRSACADRGALRSGLQVLTAFVPSGGEFVLHTALPEAMLITDDARDAFGP